MSPTGNTEHRNELPSDAIELARLGKKAEARRLLEETCRKQPGNAKTWLWRASLAETVPEAISHLERVLALEPANVTARSWHQKLCPVLSEVRTYHCFLCQHERARDFDRCPGCGSVLSLDLDATFRNEGVDERKVRAALDNIKGPAAGAEPFDTEYFLGVGCLNLKNSYEALQHFTRAAQLDERGAQLRATIDALRRRPLIMAVDDCLTIRTMISSTLERNGYRCLTVASGIDALAVLEEQSPDFVLLDISMPFMDGYVLCKTIKSLPKAKNAKVVMLSARDGFFDKVKGRLSGAADYLTKPFEPAILLRVIGKYVRTKE